MPLATSSTSVRELRVWNGRTNPGSPPSEATIATIKRVERLIRKPSGNSGLVASVLIAKLPLKVGFLFFDHAAREGCENAG